MKIHEAKKFLPFVQALADGKTVEYRNKECDDTWDDIAILPNTEWFHGSDSQNRDFRIKPKEPTMRPWTKNEVPVGALFRSKDTPLWTGVIVGNNFKVEFGREGEVSFESALGGYEHSTDNGATWHICGKVDNA